jgi:hypothetical protein
MKTAIHMLLLVLISIKLYPSPDVRCIEVMSNGNIVISWIPPADPLNQFDSYHIYFSTNASGPFVVIDSIFTYTQTSYTHSGFNGQSGIGYYYMLTRRNISGTLQYSNPSNTLSSMFLQVTNAGNNIASLTWNPIHVPQINGYSGYYHIYQSFGTGSWQLVDSTMNTLFNHFVSVCNEVISYQIRQQNAIGCISVSSTDSDVFIDVIPPDIPKFDTVSVNRTTQLAELGWQTGNDADIIGYIIYKFIGGVWSPIDTIAGTFYTDASSTADLASESYRIASLDSCKNTSPMSPEHRTIFLTYTGGSCAPNIQLSWTPYINMSPEIKEYVVYTSIDGLPYTQEAIVSAGQTTYQYAIVAGSDDYSICFFISAKSQDTIQSASSNIICYTVTRPPHPEFAYIPYVTVVNNEAVEIALHNDISVYVQGYRIEKSADGGNTFTHLATIDFLGVENINYTDFDVKVTEMSYTYRFTVIDACGVDALTSNTATTILLTGENLQELFTTQIEWSEYKGWNEGVQNYKIFRKNNTTLPIMIAQLPGGSMNYIDHLVDDAILSDEKVVYYIQAQQSAGNIFGFQEQSVSNELILIQPPRVYIANAFTPLGNNPEFKPYLVFVNPNGYHFSIYDRWGQIQFETGNISKAWDGRVNGKLVPPGSYIYIIQVIFADGTPFKKRGLVTVVY